MLSGPKGCEEPFGLQCCICGHRAELLTTGGRTGKYCLECSADVATSSPAHHRDRRRHVAGQDAAA